ADGVVLAARAVTRVAGEVDLDGRGVVAVGDLVDAAAAAHRVGSEPALDELGQVAAGDRVVAQTAVDDHVREERREPTTAGSEPGQDERIGVLDGDCV